MNFQHLRQPQAFERRAKVQEFYVRRILWAMIFGALFFFMGKAMNMDKKLAAVNFTQQNSFRFFIVCASAFGILAIFLLLTVSKEGDRAQNMIREKPFFAYSMTFSALLALFASFYFWSTLFGLSGIFFFISFWGFTGNAVMALPL
jgi:hypothetical protein